MIEKLSPSPTQQRRSSLSVRMNEMRSERKLLLKHMVNFQKHFTALKNVRKNFERRSICSNDEYDKYNIFQKCYILAKNILSDSFDLNSLANSFINFIMMLSSISQTIVL